MGAHPPQFKMELGAIVAWLLLIVLAPLCFFLLQLGRARRAGLRKYGALASRYVDEFTHKSIDIPHPPAESRCSSATSNHWPTSATATRSIREMRSLPFGRDTVMRIAVVVLLPLAPLALTMIPFDQAMKGVFKLVL